MRNTSAIVALVSFAALVLILVGVSGLMLLARQSGRHTKLATTGMFLVAFGLVMLLAGGLIQALFFSGDFPGMPYIVIPALLGVVVGLLLIGIFILRSDVLPRWLGIFFIVSSVALVAANEQTVAVLLFIPFGLAMAAAGYLMWAGGTQYATAPARGLKASWWRLVGHQQPQRRVLQGFPVMAVVGYLDRHGICREGERGGKAPKHPRD